MYLVRYEETPQVTGLEYKELWRMKEHPESKSKFKKLVEIRVKKDRRKQDEDFD